MKTHEMYYEYRDEMPTEFRADAVLVQAEQGGRWRVLLTAEEYKREVEECWPSMGRFGPVGGGPIQ